jgi:gas vesicle protein
MNISDWFFEAVPFKRRSAVDWVLPALGGLGVGLVVGFGAGLLYAPTPGEEARLRLKEGASRVKDKAVDLADKAKSRLSSTAAQLQGEINRP